MSECLVYAHEHLVASAPLIDQTLVIAAASTDQGLDQSVPFWWSADLPSQDRIELGTAVAQPASQRR
jgi:hypothetical protein